MKERNQARAQLAGAPLLVAQLDAMEFRNRMVKGDTESLRTLRLGTQTTVAEALKKLSTMPPLTLLQLCYGYEDFDFAAHLLRHADDLDFVQDTLTAVGMSDALNPILNGMLAGFNRRRFQRFKIGQVRSIKIRDDCHCPGYRRCFHKGKEQSNKGTGVG